MIEAAAARHARRVQGGPSIRTGHRLLPAILALAVGVAALPASPAQAGPAGPVGPAKGITITFLDGPVAENGSLVRVLFDANGQTAVTGFRYDTERYDKFRYAVAADAAGGTAIVSLRADHLGTLRIGVGDQDTTGAQNGTPYYAEIPVVGDPSISGLVIEEGLGRPGVTVTLRPGGRTTVTDAEGYFRFDHLSPGEYSLHVEHDQGCDLLGEASGISVPAGFRADVWGQTRQDAAGFHCHTYDILRFGYEPGATTLGLTGDNEYQEVPLPFAFNFYGQEYDTVWVDTNGYLTFGDPGASFPAGSDDFPSEAGPNRVIAPYWDDLIVDAEASVGTSSTIDEWGYQTFTIDWHNVARSAEPDKRFSFNAILDSGGVINVVYHGLDSELATNAAATVGVNGPDAGLGVCYDQLAEPLTDARYIRFAGNYGVGAGNMSC